MSNLAVKIAVIESEKDWGRKIDEWMVCLSIDDAKEFNSKNIEEKTPDWYMAAEGEPEPIQLSNEQFDKLKIEKREWLSVLKKIK